MQSFFNDWVIEGENTWIIEVFVVVFVALLVNYLARRLLNKLEKQLGKTQTLWDDALVSAARRPLTTAIWIVGITWAAEIVRAQNTSTLFEAVGPLRHVAVIVLLAWFLVRFVKRAEQNVILAQESKPEKDGPLAEESALDAQTISAIAKLLRMAIVITAALVILQTLGFSISGVLAFGGIGGIAVGFAAKDLLANFFGGLMVYLDRPFAVGDWIRSPDQEIEGTVEYIGWRQTRIRTFDKRPLYVPNSTFTHISVENPSRMTNRRIYETIGVRYDDSAVVGKIVASVKAMLREHQAIDTNQTLMVNFNAFNDSSMDFFIYCFTRTTNWAEFHEIKQDVLLKILALIESEGAEVAFPTREVHLRAEPSEAQSG